MRIKFNLHLSQQPVTIGYYTANDRQGWFPFTGWPCHLTWKDSMAIYSQFCSSSKTCSDAIATTVCRFAGLTKLITNNNNIVLDYCNQMFLPHAHPRRRVLTDVMV